MDKKINRIEKVKQWLRTERDIFDGNNIGPNEFDPYVPVEVRERSLTMRSIGVAPPFTEIHIELWVALGEAMGIEKFDKPLGWGPEEVKTHLFGQ